MEAALPLSLRHHRPFTLYWLMTGCRSSASQIMTVALGWRVYELTGQALDLGLIGLVQFLPALLLALPAGHAVDRYSRRMILRGCLALDVGAALLLCLGSAAGQMGVESIFLAAALLGVAQAFEWPASTALLAGIVPRAAYPQAVAWNTSIRQTATILGPALGGLLYGFGPMVAFAACAGAWLAALGFAATLPKAAQALPHDKATLRSVLAGLAFIWRRKEIFGAISLDLFAVLLGGATALLPVYARDILFVGPVGLGMLRSAPAAGALLVSAALARWPLRRHNGTAMFASVALFGVATCVFAVSRNITLSLAALAVLGAGDMISVYVRLTLVQLRTPDDMRGRVSAVNGIFIGTSNQLGEFESGVTATLFGTVPAVLLGGIGTLAVVALFALLVPSLRRVDRLDDS
ncbi:MAG: MFS transporter [Aliidongia sp.]